MESLDVKFVVHQGEFIRQKMSGREELAGRDVILVHRLLKNEVGRTFGARAYALYSDACVQAMGIDPRAQVSSSTPRRSSISARRSAG
jgi:hypothetical protein